ARLRLLQQDSGTDTKINSDIIVVGNATPFEQLCAQAFSKLVLRPVSFRQSSAEIRTSSFVTLDRITEFAGDCRHAVIMIAGHTDSTSNESWNQQLSLARAQAVANHIARNGIDPQRLLVQGMGSSLPLADNSTVQGRGLNRRIEFDLL
ncbi:MAG: OmpA family protein, partial [Gammaproteobacteria bacterium]|nr:OmpA family protein [Gammaproteobacteria bacterium]